MWTASHTVRTQPCTAPVAEARWTRCDCCWRAGLTTASRTTTTTPPWWWPWTRKWAWKWQKKKTCAINHSLLKFSFYCIVCFSLFLWLWVAASGEFRLCQANSELNQTDCERLPCDCPSFQSLAVILWWKIPFICYVNYVRTIANNCKICLTQLWLG